MQGGVRDLSRDKSPDKSGEGGEVFLQIPGGYGIIWAGRPLMQGGFPSRRIPACRADTRRGTVPDRVDGGAADVV